MMQGEIASMSSSRIRRSPVKRSQVTGNLEDTSVRSAGTGMEKHCRRMRNRRGRKECKVEQWNLVWDTIPLDRNSYGT